MNCLRQSRESGEISSCWYVLWDGPGSGYVAACAVVHCFFKSSALNFGGAIWVPFGVGPIASWAFFDEVWTAFVEFLIVGS